MENEINSKEIQFFSLSQNFHIRIPDNLFTPQISRIFSEFLPKALDLFINKNASYQGKNGNVSERFGTAGQFMKLSDKVEKLKKPLWDDRGVGEELPFEGVEEVLMDMLGHILLTADIYQKVRIEKGIE